MLAIVLRLVFDTLAAACRGQSGDSPGKSLDCYRMVKYIPATYGSQSPYDCHRRRWTAPAPAKNQQLRHSCRNHLCDSWANSSQSNKAKPVSSRRNNLPPLTTKNVPDAGGFLTSVSSLAIAVCALALSGYSAWQSRTTTRLSARPYVQLSFYFDDTGAHWNYRNVGLGPAIVKSFEVSLDNQPVTSWNQLAVNLDLPQFTFAVPGVGNISQPYRPGDTDLIFSVPADERARLMQASKRVRIKTCCYCSSMSNAGEALTTIRPRGYPWKFRRAALFRRTSGFASSRPRSKPDFQAS